MTSILRKKSATLILMLGCGLAGCYSTAKRETSLNAARMEAFLTLKKLGVTTPADDSDMLKANWAAWHAMNYYLNSVEIPAEVTSYLATVAPTTSR